ncbi:putative ankyrin repeat protein RF_0381 [Haliotis asinina]|uniref:putative ankyrin repeat protein RF_0381 n=1 Tax=Haliotis asinina TaxID=109174 RepID=UPI0035319479
MLESTPRHTEHHGSSFQQFRPDPVIQNRSDQMFNKACLVGNISLVKQLISRGEVDINNVSPGGWTPVMIAVSKGHKQVLNTLLKEKCDLSLMLDNGDDILHVACSGSNTDIVKGLVSNGEISLERKDLSGRTPIMKAALSGNKKAFDLLVDEHCNLFGIDYNRNNLLHAACSGGCVYIVNYLLTHKIADIETRGGDGRTPVMVAARNGQKRVFDLLVKKGCNLHVMDDLGDTVLHVACCSDSVYIVTYLLSNRIVDIEATGEYGLTPVMCAAMEGQTKVFNVLVSKGCDRSVVDDEGENILHAACYSDNVMIVKHILSWKSVDINSKGDHGDTPLMVAAREGNRKVFDLLVSHDCDPFEVSGGGNILHAACDSNNAVLVKDILSHGIADIESRDENGATPVMLAAEAGQKKVFDLLMGEGCSLKVIDDYGCNILHAACNSDNVEIVEYLLSREIASINSKDSNGLTPVMTAATNGHKKVYDLLARKGCDLSVNDSSENTILHAACASDNDNLVNCILSREIAGIESRGEDEQTPVMVAAGNGQRKVFDLLVHRGCDLSVRDDYGNNILHVASLGGNVQIVEYLLSRDYLLSRNIIHTDSRNNAGWTPVMLAAANGQKGVFDLLVRNKCDLNVFTKDCNNILHAASYGGNVNIVESILSREVADKDSRGQNGATPVMLAAKNGQKRVFDLLVGKDCNLSVEDDSGRNILHYACLGDNVQIVESIRSREVTDKNGRGENGETLVMRAAAKGNKKVCDLLVGKGWNLSVEDDSGRSVLESRRGGARSGQQTSRCCLC